MPLRHSVEVSRDHVDVFEQMHYVCFHYEFEDAPADRRRMDSRRLPARRSTPARMVRA